MKTTKASSRPIWKGFLRLSLVSVPVKVFTAKPGSRAPIQFHQLCDACHSRLKHPKICPEHGEIEQDHVVSGYEFSKGEYIVVSPEELDRLRSAEDKTISIDRFVPPETIDPIYHTGATYYVIPDGAVGTKPYAMLRRTMLDKGLHAVARVVLFGKEHVVLLRPLSQLLAMTVLEYASHIEPASNFNGGLNNKRAGTEEASLMDELVSSLVDQHFDMSEYTDEYAEKVSRLIQAKVNGQELPAASTEEEPPIINLTEALKHSLERTMSHGNGTRNGGGRSPRPTHPARGKARAAKAKHVK